MKTRTTVTREKMALAVSAAFLLQTVPCPGWAAKDIPTGNVDLTVLAAIAPVLDETNTRLVKWRTGTSGQVPANATAVTFNYFASGTNLALPFFKNSDGTGNVKDGTANNENSLWSDNAVKLVYTKGNSLSSAILINTANNDSGTTDPRYIVGPRGGWAGGGVSPDPTRASILPMIWKAVSETDCKAASGANAIAGPVLDSKSPFRMYGQTNTAGGTCPATDLGSGAVRPSIGYCDFATHAMLDPNNWIHVPTMCDAGRWYSDYGTGGVCNGTGDAAKRKPAFDYATAVNAYGVATTENAIGTGLFNPAYLLIGMDASNAIQTTYSASIHLEIRTQ